MKPAFAHWAVRLPVAICIIALSFAVAYTVVATVAFTAIFDFIAGNSNIDSKTADFVYMAIFSICLLVGQYFMNAARAGKVAMTFGFAPTPFALRHFAQGIAFALASVGILFGLYVLAGAEVTLAENELPIISTLLIFFAALMEELVFRGLLFEPFSERFGEAKTTVGISLLFAVAHIPNPNASVMGIANVALAGIMLSVMRIASRTLWMPLGFHFGWNWSLGIGLGMSVSGQDFSPIFHTRLAAAPSVWLGGAFGVEESLITTILLLVATAAVMLYTKSDPFVAAAEFRRRYAEDGLLQRQREVN
ncbi:hypothetical protein MASR2M18_00030 [Ignavibacteria bacterium]|nr:CPBP family intramembrane metalloprotease [Bacteroidota bacterium]MCZ2131798.1 CPBP family intramembrane metalloprotease [Bacteroidota bacterium]